MSDSITPAPQPQGEAPRMPPKRRNWLLLGCGGLLALLLIIVATVAVTIWWIQRPIKPVVFSENEKQVVDSKLQQMRGEPVTSRNPQFTTANSTRTPAANRTYQPGGKELRLTERELNGLLNQNTDLGRTVRLELDSNAINAYLAVPLPQDFPIGGGRTFRARGRFRLSLVQGQAPVAMLEDVTVLGLSLPKEWLGGLKGKNLMADALGDNATPMWRGIKSLRVVPGAIVLEVGY